MAFKSIISVAIACLAVITTNANAAIMNADWKITGDNLITQDTGSGLEWLDLTVTSDLSYDYVNNRLGLGQDFEGWRYATAEEVTGFWDAFGGDSNYYNGLSTQNNGLFDLIAPYWGDLFCNYSYSSCNTGDGYSFAFTGEAFGGVSHMLALASDYNALTNYLTHDEFTPSYMSLNDRGHYYDVGSALVRDISAVPIPAAVWLFGSGFIGLIGVARKRTNA